MTKPEVSTSTPSSLLSDCRKNLALFKTLKQRNNPNEKMTATFHYTLLTWKVLT